MHSKLDDILVDKAVEPTHPSESRIADIFLDRESDGFRYVAVWGAWLRWDGVRWKEEATLLVQDKIKSICQELARDTRNNSEIRSLLKFGTIAGAERIARADRRVAATFDQWDKDPWLLNTPGGVVDLRTGRIRPATPKDYMTKVTGVRPDHSCPTPKWDAHLEKVFAQNTEIIEYMYRVFGYCLTGSVREKALWFNYGDGDNGKSTTMNVLHWIWGEYARIAPMEMFLYKKFGHEHPTELADLFGARLVMATETEQGKGWSEARLKYLTGGDPIKARKMRKDWFEFPPTHKLMFSGNHRPSLRSPGEAMKSRFNMVPFVVHISKEERIKEIDDQLRAEAPGILHKMIEGCAAWQRDGLNPPTIVTDATKEYMEAEDSLGLWFEKCVEVGNKNDLIFTEVLYASYKEWMAMAGEAPLLQKSFVNELMSRAKTLRIQYLGRFYKETVVNGNTITRRGRGFGGIAKCAIPERPM